MIIGPSFDELIGRQMLRGLDDPRPAVSRHGSLWVRRRLAFLLIGVSTAGLAAVVLIAGSGDPGAATMLCLAFAGAHLVAAGLYFAMTAERRRRPANAGPE